MTPDSSSTRTISRSAACAGGVRPRPAAEGPSLHQSPHCEQFAGDLVSQHMDGGTVDRMTRVGQGPGRLRRISDSLSPSEWRRVAGMAATVIGLTVLGLVTLFAAIPHHYHLSRTGLFGFGTGVLAYTLGMRHAFDADHIAAIDNTTRKLMADGKRPLSVGFWFSLGHSSIVFALAVLLSLGVKSLVGPVRNGNSSLHHYTSLIGTSISGAFLIVLAVI